MRRRLADALVLHLRVLGRQAPGSSRSESVLPSMTAIRPCATARPCVAASAAASSSGRPHHAPSTGGNRRPLSPNRQHRRGAASSPAPKEEDDDEGAAAPRPPPPPPRGRGRPPSRAAVAAVLEGAAGRPPPAAAPSSAATARINRRLADAGRAMPRGVWGVLQKLRDEGHAAYLVGGAVRDTLAGGRPKDFDILTTAPPSTLLRFFRKARLIGVRFPVVHVLGSGRDVHEVSTLLPVGAAVDAVVVDAAVAAENEAATTTTTTPLPPQPRAARAARQRAALVALDGGVWPADPDAREAAIAAALAASASTRDFTVNALFFDPWSGEVADPTGRGLADLAARRLTSVAEPGASFTADPARMLRAVRLASRTGLRLAPGDAAAVAAHAHLVATLSAGRLGGEVTALLAHGHAAPAVALARRWGVLAHLLPAHAALLDVECGPVGGSGEAVDESGDTPPPPSRHVRTPARVGGMAALPALDRHCSPSSPAPPAVVAAALLMPLLADEVRRWTPGRQDEAASSGSEGDEPAAPAAYETDRPPETPPEAAFRRCVGRAIDRLCVPVPCADSAVDPNTRLISRMTAAAAGRMLRHAARGALVGGGGGDGSGGGGFEAEDGAGAVRRPPRATSSAVARYEAVFRECVPLAARLRDKVEKH